MHHRQYVQPEITISNFLEELRSVISPLLLDIFRRLQYIFPFHSNNIFFIILLACHQFYLGVTFHVLK